MWRRDAIVTVGRSQYRAAGSRNIQVTAAGNDAVQFGDAAAGSTHAQVVAGQHNGPADGEGVTGVIAHAARRRQRQIQTDAVVIAIVRHRTIEHDAIAR